MTAQPSQTMMKMLGQAPVPAPRGYFARTDTGVRPYEFSLDRTIS